MIDIAERTSTWMALGMASLILLTGTVRADFDGDGRADIFVVKDGRSQRFEATGGLYELEYIPEDKSSRVTCVTVGNFDADRDGKLDLFIGRTGPGSSVWWYEPLGNNSMYLMFDGMGSNVSTEGLAVGYGHGEEHPDLYQLRRGSVFHYENTRDNQYRYITNRLTTRALCVATGDLNHSRGYDLLIGKADRLEWYESDGNAVSLKQSFMGLNVAALALGDLDGDSASDLVVVDANQAGRLRWFEVKSSDALELVEVDTAISKNRNFTGTAIGDVDGDGKAELLATRSDGPVRWFILGPDTRMQEVSGTRFGDGAVAIAISGSSPRESWGPAVQELNDKRITVIERKSAITHQEDLNFPQFKISPAGRYGLSYGTGDHASTGWFTKYSDDQGATWHGFTSGSPHFLTLMELPRKTISLPNNVREVRWSYNNWSSTTTYKIQTGPGSESGRHRGFFRTILLGNDGATLLATSWATLYESSDHGLNWTKRSVIATRRDWMGEHGPGETVMVRLTNGNLLAVMRTGDIGRPIYQPPEDCPLAYTISTDDGRTWGEPVNMRCPGVFPDMLALESGTVVLVSGRPGVYIRLADQTGTRWTEPIFVYSGTGCANSSLSRDVDGSLVLAYTESDFCDAHEHPGYDNYIKLLRFKVNEPLKW